MAGLVSDNNRCIVVKRSICLHFLEIDGEKSVQVYSKRHTLPCRPAFRWVNTRCMQIFNRKGNKLHQQWMKEADQTRRLIGGHALIRRVFVCRSEQSVSSIRRGGAAGKCFKKDSQLQLNPIELLPLLPQSLSDSNSTITIKCRLSFCCAASWENQLSADCELCYKHSWP